MIAGAASPDPPSPQAAARGETEEQRLDRNFNELLQELRVTQNGAQILFAFLLTLPFTQRFPEITPFQRVVYVGTLLAAATATALLIAPVPLHRLLYGSGRKRLVVRTAGRLALAGVSCLVLAVSGGVLLVLDVTLGGAVPFVLSGLVLGGFVLLWGVLPAWRSRQDRPG